VPEAVKDARLQRLQDLLRLQQDAFNRSLLGQTVPVLYERAGRNAGQMVGKTPWLQPVHAPADSAVAGRVLATKILSLAANSLGGTIVDETHRSTERRSA
jgi:tRNA-2-methylthio-N6-dimethylallyladenosine synthase